MTFDGAVIREQGVTFAIAMVKRHVIRSSDRDNVQRGLTRYFPGMPIVLMAEDGSETYGRRDIVRFLENVHPSQIPWRRYSA
jgi:hypothetical protein